MRLVGAQNNQLQRDKDLTQRAGSQRDATTDPEEERAERKTKGSINLIIRRRHLHLISHANVKPTAPLMSLQIRRQLVICSPVRLFCSNAKLLGTTWSH